MYFIFGKMSIIGGKFLFKYACSIDMGVSISIFVSLNILNPLSYFGLITYRLI